MESDLFSRDGLYAARRALGTCRAWRVIGAIGTALLCQAAQAQSSGLGPKLQAADQGDNPAYSAQLAPPQAMLPAGHVPRYRITFMRSGTTTPLRSSTVISITNHGTAACATSVDWFVGFGGVACTTALNLGPGQTGEHCSRPLPGAIVSCNASCAPVLSNHEGSALVGAANVASCSALAISARTHYTTGDNDDNLSSTTDAKVVRAGGTNNGD